MSEPVSNPYTLDPADLARLREKAEAATPGPWRVPTRDTDLAAGICDIGLTLRVVSDDDTVNGDDWDDDAKCEPDARFIAAASPDVVLALLDEVERLRAERDEAIAEIAALKGAIAPGDDDLATDAAVTLVLDTARELESVEQERQAVHRYNDELADEIAALRGQKAPEGWQREEDCWSTLVNAGRGVVRVVVDMQDDAVVRWMAWSTWGASISGVAPSMTGPDGAFALATAAVREMGGSNV